MPDTPPLAGQVVVVAGTLARLGRKELDALVTRQLGRLQSAVTRDTTLLVLGADVVAGRDARPVAAGTTPDARRLAEALRLNARYPGRVRILSEREFLDLLGIPVDADAATAAKPTLTVVPRTAASRTPPPARLTDDAVDHADMAEARTSGDPSRSRSSVPAPVDVDVDVDVEGEGDVAGDVGGDVDESTALYSSRALRGLYPALRDDHLRYLEQWGLVRPVRRSRHERFYRFADLAIIRQASAELARGHAFRAVVRGLVSEREGQLALDFQPPTGDTQPAKVIALTPRARPAANAAGVPPRPADPDTQAMAARYFGEGSELDRGNDAEREEAMTAYRHAIMLDPTMVAAVVNLANLYYARDAIVEAEALYEKALRLDEGCFEAHFNLGNVHHDTGRFEAAVHRYEQALAIDPQYADAHFYLAVALEKLGRSADARPHWQSYQRLAPQGEWVELAKEFSSQT